jgi:hypothetical protein
MMLYLRAEAAGGRKAPRHEIAEGVYRRQRGRYGDFTAGFGLLRLERRGWCARFSSKDAGSRGWERVDRTLADLIEGSVAVQSRELMRVRSLPAASQQE